MMTKEKYLGIKQQHPVFSLLDRACGTIPHGLRLFVSTRVLWLAAIVPACMLPSSCILLSLRKVLSPLGLGAVLPQRVSQLNRPRMMAAGGCMAITSLRQILQSTYISPNGNNFGTAGALAVRGMSRPQI
jgi:hypothetical protein